MGAMNNEQYEYLPIMNSWEIEDDYCNEVDVIGDSPCPYYYT